MAAEKNVVAQKPDKWSRNEIVLGSCPSGPFVQIVDYERLESLLRDARAEIERFRAMTVCTMGVGDGSGKLFVHGGYDSIKAAQALVLRAERAEALAGELRQIANSYKTAVFAKQAKIDELMMEYCPGEMTQAQRDEWARHQVPADAAIDALAEGGRE